MCRRLPSLFARMLRGLPGLPRSFSTVLAVRANPRHLCHVDSGLLACAHPPACLTDRPQPASRCPQDRCLKRTFFTVVRVAGRSTPSLNPVVLCAPVPRAQSRACEFESYDGTSDWCMHRRAMSAPPAPRARCIGRGDTWPGNRTCLFQHVFFSDGAFTAGPRLAGASTEDEALFMHNRCSTACHRPMTRRAR